MTLFKQIALLVSLVFLLLASIIAINDFRRTGEFMQGQLQTTAQDMATALGIAVSNLPAADDRASLEVMFNAVFDSGFYSSIELIAVDGSVIHQKSQLITIEGVPSWFLKTGATFSNARFHPGHERLEPVRATKAQLASRLCLQWFVSHPGVYLAMVFSVVYCCDSGFMGVVTLPVTAPTAS